MQDKSDPTAAGNKAVDDSLSEAELIAQLSQGPELEADEAEEEESDESEEPEDEAEEAEPEEPEEEEEEPNEASGIDFNNLTDEEWEIVRTQLKSRAAGDIQALRRELAAKDKTIEALQQQQPKAAQPEPVESKLLKGVDSPKALADKVTDLKKLRKTAEALLDENEDLGPDDPFEHDGVNVTKRQLKRLRSDITEALEEAVPYLQSRFALREQWEAEQVQFDEAAKKQIPDIADEKSEVGKAYKNMMSDPRLKKIQELVPEIAPQLGYLLAHASRSIFGGKVTKAKVEQPTTTGKIKKVRPPSSPSGVAAAPPNTKDPKQTAKDAKMKRFGESGDPEDLIAAWS